MLNHKLSISKFRKLPAVHQTNVSFPHQHQMLMFSFHEKNHLHLHPQRKSGVKYENEKFKTQNRHKDPCNLNPNNYRIWTSHSPLNTLSSSQTQYMYGVTTNSELDNKLYA